MNSSPEIELRSVRGTRPVNALKWIGEKKIPKWVWISLAALFIFAVLFGFGAVIAFILFLFDQASQKTVEWAEPQAKRAAHAARRGVAHLEEEISKKLPHRPVGA
jgi:hypothetical protein